MLLLVMHPDQRPCSQVAMVAVDAAVEEVEEAVTAGMTMGTVDGTTIAGKGVGLDPAEQLSFLLFCRACWQRLYRRCLVFYVCAIPLPCGCNG